MCLSSHIYTLRKIIFREVLKLYMFSIFTLVRPTWPRVLESVKGSKAHLQWLYDRVNLPLFLLHQVQVGWNMYSFNSDLYHFMYGTTQWMSGWTLIMNSEGEVSVTVQQRFKKGSLMTQGRRTVLPRWITKLRHWNLFCQLKKLNDERTGFCPDYDPS